jgi:hypothetical protein
MRDSTPYFYFLLSCYKMTTFFSAVEALFPEAFCPVLKELPDPGFTCCGCLVNIFFILRDSSLSTSPHKTHCGRPSLFLKVSMQPRERNSLLDDWTQSELVGSLSRFDDRGEWWRVGPPRSKQPELALNRERTEQRSHWTESALNRERTEQRAHWTESALNRERTEQRAHWTGSALNRERTEQRAHWTESALNREHIEQGAHW